MIEKREINWLNTVVITLTPIVALLGTLLYIHKEGFRVTDLICFVVMYFSTGLSITAGYHRLFSHRAYNCHPIVQFFYLIFGAAALQNSALNWSRDHRAHHRNTDSEKDPYNIKKGFFWAHMGWIFFKDSDSHKKLENCLDLKKSRLLLWQHKYYVPLAVIVGLGIPFLIGLAFDRPWGGVFWGGFLRLVFGHHCTFLINSAAHLFGSQPYSKAFSARDSWWLAFFSYGEGYHNFHHTFPSDYRNGIAWYHWDPTKWLIRVLNISGLSWNLRRTPAFVIERIRK